MQNPYLQESVQIVEEYEAEPAPAVLRPVIDALIEKAEEKAQEIDVVIAPLQDEIEKKE